MPTASEGAAVQGAGGKGSSRFSCAGDLFESGILSWSERDDLRSWMKDARRMPGSCTPGRRWETVKVTVDVAPKMMSEFCW